MKKSKINVIQPAQIEWLAKKSCTTNDTADSSQNENDDQAIPYHKQFDDIYFSNYEPLQETLHTFLDNGNIVFDIQKRDCTNISELGFGGGVNFLALTNLLQEKNITNQIHYYSCEKYPLDKTDLQKFSALFPKLQEQYQELLRHYVPLVEGWYNIFFKPNIELHLYIGDVEDFAQKLQDESNDVVFLDGHSPAKNKEMWNADLLALLAQKTKRYGVVRSFSVAGFVRHALQENGFETKKIDGSGKKRSVLFAQKIRHVTNKKEIARTTKNMNAEFPWYSLKNIYNEQVEPAKQSVTIVGAGVSGCSLAYHLAKEGFLVTIVDRHNDIAQEASGNPVGMVHPNIAACPEALGVLSLQAYHYLVQIIQELSQKGINFSHKFLPVQFFYFDHDQQAKFNKRLLDFQKWNNHFFHYQAEENYTQLQEALYVSPSEFCSALLQAADIFSQKHHKKNIVRKFSHDVVDCSYQANKWNIVTKNLEQKFSTDILIFCSGKELPQQSENFSLRLLGGHVLFKEEKYENLKTLFNSKHYLIPSAFLRNKYVTLCGSGFTENLQEHPPQDDFINELNKNFYSIFNKNFIDKLPVKLNNQLFHEIAEKPREEKNKNFYWRFSVRCHSKDFLPLVGAVPHWEFFHEHYADLKKGKRAFHYPQAMYKKNLYVLGAMGSKGLLFASWSAKILSEMIAQKPITISESIAQHIHPARFWIRALYKN